MSRSNPIETSANPCARWFQWDAAEDGGVVSWWDKDRQERVKCEKFAFLLLDELATVKGWHDPSESGIYANEVRDLRSDVLVVKSFKGGELAVGTYASIKDRVAVLGGKFSQSCYIAFKDEEGQYRLGNIQFTGAGIGPWIEFKKEAGQKRDLNGKLRPAVYVDAVSIKGFTEGQKGRVRFRSPKFSLVAVSAEANEIADSLDAELQEFLKAYLARGKSDQAQSTAQHHHADDTPQRPKDEAWQAMADKPKQTGSGFDDMDDDIPF